MWEFHKSDQLKFLRKQIQCNHSKWFQWSNLPKINKNGFLFLNVISGLEFPLLHHFVLDNKSSLLDPLTAAYENSRKKNPIFSQGRERKNVNHTRRTESNEVGCMCTLYTDEQCNATIHRRTREKSDLLDANHTMCVCI